MNWTDSISMALSIVAIIVSCLTSLIVASPHLYIHAICEADNQYILLMIINNGFSPGLLFTDYGIVYRKNGTQCLEPVKGVNFKPSVPLHEKDRELFWEGKFLKTIAPQETIFVVLSKREVSDKLKELEMQNVKKVCFYLLTSTPWGKSQTKRIQSKPHEIKELLNCYENYPH